MFPKCHQLAYIKEVGYSWSQYYKHYMDGFLWLSVFLSFIKSVWKWFQRYLLPLLLLLWLWCELSRPLELKRFLKRCIYRYSSHSWCGRPFRGAQNTYSFMTTKQTPSADKDSVMWLDAPPPMNFTGGYVYISLSVCRIFVLFCLMHRLYGHLKQTSDEKWAKQIYTASSTFVSDLQKLRRLTLHDWHI